MSALTPNATRILEARYLLRDPAGEIAEAHHADDALVARDGKSPDCVPLHRLGSILEGVAGVQGHG